MAAQTKKGARAARNMQRRLSNLTARSERGTLRETCKLDAQAMELGLYDMAYHCMNRKQRKSLVSQALSKQLKAA